MTQVQKDAFSKRYIERRIYHLRSKRIFRIPFLRSFCRPLVRLELLLFRKPVVPAVEYVVTTRCSLRCVDCANYIPSIPPEKQCMVPLEEFREDIDNLLCGARKINLLGLLGGEPLLNRELPAMLESACGNRRIEHVMIVTNGTVMVSEELLPVLKRFRHKCSVTVSNYTGNPKLCRTLKSREIRKLLSENGIACRLNEDLKWVRTEPYRDFERSDAEIERYFLACNVYAYSILKRKMYVCPKAGTFDLLGNCPAGPGDCLDLSKPCRTKDIFDFFHNARWMACNFCTTHEKRETVPPAIQPE